MSFVHLHTHSHYSLLDGLAKIKDLVSEAKKMGMPALALTDHGNMYGAIEFYKACKKADIKPILGLEAYIAEGSLHDKRPNIDDKRYHLTILVKNKEGYKNLVRMVSTSYLEGFYYKPRLDKEILRKYSLGLIALSGCMNGEIPKALLNSDFKKAEKLLLEYQEIFGKENFFIEVSSHPNVPNHNILRTHLIEFSKKTGVPLVATQDVHYLKKEDSGAQDVLLAVQTNTKLDDEDRLTMKDEDYSLSSPQEMYERFFDIPESAKNTLLIAEMCNLDLELGKFQLPHFPVPKNETQFSYLKKMCLEGINRRYGNASKEIFDRLHYELSVLQETGFVEYFLVVADFVHWAKQNGIIVGPGRGSVAGSLAAYVLEITNIDPIKYTLIFERFLNPARVEPPDIDLDFADERRNDVIEYVAQKYGRDRVAQIITFGTMAARAAVRDAGRALGMSLVLCDRIAKMIPFNPNQGEHEGYLKKCLKEVADLKSIYENDENAKKIIDAATKLEGVVRHASVHASGVVISRDPLTESVPLQQAASKGEFGERTESIVTQYDMHSVLDLGLLKMDFLGLSNLTIIEETLKLIKERHGKVIDIDNLNLDDPGPYKMLSEGKTVGVFQLEGSGMTRYLKELRPTSLEDIIAMVALFRPGPIELIPSFIKRKHGEEKVTYLHPRLEPILKNTYGIAVYQEQLMQITRDLGGFTLSQADILRKAIGKKIRKLLEEQKEKFVAGMKQNNIPHHIANELGELLEPFARYGFNRSHAACYAMIGYQTAYLKCHYPIEFMTALLNAEQKNIDRISFLIKECKNLNIPILPPSVNKSRKTFSIFGQEIRFGLATIKNVGVNVVDALIFERQKNGDFLNIQNFLERIDSKDFNKKSIEALAKTGALDELGERNEVLMNMERILEYARLHKSAKSQNQSSLFSLVTDNSSIPQLRLGKTTPVSLEEKLRWEKELLGVYVSGHPMEKVTQSANYQNTKNKLDIEKFKAQKPTRLINIAGMITESRRIFTKNGDPMMFIKLQDLGDEIEGVIFPKILEQFGHHIVADNCVIILGRYNERNGTPSIIAEEIKSIY